MYAKYQSNVYLQCIVIHQEQISPLVKGRTCSSVLTRECDTRDPSP